ncbi:MAG TPA: hypothetical protein VIU12_17405 [Chryseolinea sp.]
MITHATGDTLFGWTLREAENEQNRRKAYRNDLPPQVKMKLDERETPWNGFQTGDDAVIDTVRFLPEKWSVIVYLRTSEGIGFPGKKAYLEDIDSYSKEFSRQKMIELPLASVHFVPSDEYIATYNEKDIINHMYVLDDKIIGNLRLEIWRAVSDRNSH